MYDTYIIDDKQADRKHLRDLLVQYQIQNGVEARITGCTFADQLTPQTVTVMYFLDAAGGRVQPVIAQVRAGQTQHHIVLTAPSFQQLIQAVTAETLPTGLLLKPVGAEELFRLLRAVEQPSAVQTQATYVWTVKARRYSIAQDAILYFESRSKKTFLVTAAQEYELSASLDALEEQLGSRFVRTHRSYLVNQRHILSYEACEASVQSDIRQLPDANLFEQTLLQAPRPGHDPLLFFRGLNFYRSPRVPAFSHLALYELAWISPRRYFRLPSVPIRIHEFQSNRMKRSEYQFIINDPISIPPIGILALPGDAAPQPWLTNAVLHHLQTQTESSYAEEEHEHL